jgi:hypothetical protein
LREKHERLFASVYANDETAISAWCFRVDSERVGTAGPAGQTGPPYVGDLVDRWIGAGRGGRTPTRLPSADFESAASASSAIPAWHVLLSLTPFPPSPHLCRRESLGYSVRPNSPDAEGVQSRISTEDRYVAGKCLGSDHGIERITILGCEPSGGVRSRHQSEGVYNQRDS